MNQFAFIPAPPKVTPRAFPTWALALQFLSGLTIVAGLVLGVWGYGYDSINPSDEELTTGAGLVFAAFFLALAGAFSFALAVVPRRLAPSLVSLTLSTVVLIAVVRVVALVV